MNRYDPASQIPRQQPRQQPGSGSPFGSLSLTLFLSLFGVVIAAFAAYAYFNARATAEQWRQTVESYAVHFSELIKQSTHYGMLLNRKQDVHHIIETVARTPGVEGVRIYDKQGVIIFSAAAAEIGTRVDLQAEACVICHASATPLASVPSGTRVRLYASDGVPVLGLISPIENSTACSTADCHAHPPGQRVLGVLDVKMSMADAEARLAETERLSVTAAVLIALAVGAFSAAFIFHTVRRPVRRLIEGAERVARGDLDTRLEVGPRNEIGQLAQAFNRMTTDLGRARHEVTEWSETLERKVVEKTEELGRTQRQVLHMEKMASLGKLAATVAHELNNPLAGILNYAKLVERSLGDDLTDPERRQQVTGFLHAIQKESRRSGDIVKNLLLFARRSGAELALHPLNPILDRALMLVHHHLQMSSVVLEERRIEGDDRIVCDADQVEQALVALLVNAVEAMEGGGTLSVEAETLGDDSVRIRVADTGAGIAPQALPHIFEPFFTTKEGGEGAGLGLSVVYGIVQRHGGRIDVDSQPGRGTAFTLVLPRRPPPAAGGVPQPGGSAAIPPSEEKP